MEPNKLKFAETHEWIAAEGQTARVGVSDHAQREMSDVVFVELPAAGKDVKQKESCMVVESVKAAFDVYAPVSGKITRVNEKLKNEPQLVNQSPYEDGWLFEVELSDPSELGALMDAEAYEKAKTTAH
ncbi:MAG: glycine cleavage system protein GcvH [Candidatus Omnitrophica bacterium]|nr:glycine cleavage system protein GcvH [Candidatus Omnitrophota bacterium]